VTSLQVCLVARQSARATGHESAIGPCLYFLHGNAFWSVSPFHRDPSFGVA